MWSSSNRYVISGDPRTRELDLFHLVVAPTFACNLRCKHCYLPNHSSQRMSWSTLATLLDQYARVVERERGTWGGVFHLKGGEPSTMPYFEKVLARINEMKLVRLMITTNGLALSDEAIESMQDMRREMGEAVIVTVSVDGGSRAVHEATRGGGSYDKTWTTIRRLVAAGIPVHVNCVVTQRSKDTVPALLEMSLENGVTQVNLLPFVRQGFGQGIPEQWLSPVERYEWLEALHASVSREHRELLYGSLVDLAEKTEGGLKECVAGYVGLFYILPDGAVYSCPRLVHSDLVAGHLAREAFEDVHRRMRNGVFQRWIPKTANGAADYSCKGAVLEELRGGNEEIVAQEESVRMRIADKVRSQAGRPIAACFSRNI